jgi:hypothetical protein
MASNDDFGSFSQNMPSGLPSARRLAGNHRREQRYETPTRSRSKAVPYDDSSYKYR